MKLQQIRIIATYLENLLNMYAPIFSKPRLKLCAQTLKEQKLFDLKHAACPKKFLKVKILNISSKVFNA